MPMETLKTVIMVVTGHRGRKIDEEDFVRFLSYTKNWIPPDYARRLFKVCVQMKLLKKDGDKYVPSFEYSGTIPLDFRVTKKMVDKYSEVEDVFTRLLDHISKYLNIHRKEALMEINRIKKETIYISVEVAALIYCKIHNVPCEEYYPYVERKLVV
ncbi:MAG: DUF2240 family protein [Euryarchaeota archaeon]|nr:DUF2240 family protein [Euryarchaeota archaeon]